MPDNLHIQYRSPPPLAPPSLSSFTTTTEFHLRHHNPPPSLSFTSHVSLCFSKNRSILPQLPQLDTLLSIQPLTVAPTIFSIIAPPLNTTNPKSSFDFARFEDWRPVICALYLNFNESRFCFYFKAQRLTLNFDFHSLSRFNCNDFKAVRHE